MTRRALPSSPACSACATAALLGIAALHLWLALPAAPGGFLSDDALYLLMAEWFAGVREPVVELVARHSHLPPLYPMVLAAVGARGDWPLPGHALNALLTAATLTLAWRLHRRRQPDWLALAGVLLVALLPGVMLQSLTLWSEPLYGALAMAALLLADGAGRDGRRWTAAAALAGLALLARSAALALLLALAVELVRRRPRRAWLMAVWAAAPAAAWWLFVPPREVEQGYLDLLLGVLTGRDGTTLPEQLGANLKALAAGWLDAFDLLDAAGARLAAAAALVPVAIGWLARLRRAAPDALYVLAYLGMILPWPATGDVLARLLLPLLPFAAGYATDCGLLVAGRLGARHASGRPLLAMLPLFLLGAAAAPSVALATTRLLQPPPTPLTVMAHSPWWLREADRERALHALDRRLSAWQAARSLRDHVPHQGCLYARPVQFFMLHARRPTYLPSARAASNPPGCRYAFSALMPNGMIVIEALPAGSVLVHAPTTRHEPPQPAGMLYRLPDSRPGTP